VVKVVAVLVALLSASFGTMLVAPAAMAQTYPLADTLELRDSNGRLLDSTTPTCPADGVGVRSTGWSPNSVVQGEFFSTRYDLGKHPVDSDGVLSFTFRVEGVENGMHTLRLTGTGAKGQPRVVEASILCQCKTPGEQPSAVLGSSLDRVAGSVGTNAGNGSGAFGKTGVDAAQLAAIGFGLLTVGLTLTLARRRLLAR
jgi:hypothetical protein